MNEFEYRFLYDLRLTAIENGDLAVAEKLRSYLLAHAFYCPTDLRDSLKDLTAISV